MLRIRFHARSDVGRRREQNEDSFSISDEDAFAVVCDGMGGHEGGEIASRLGVEVLTERLIVSSQKLRKAKRPTARALARSLVLESTKAANDEIYGRSGEATPVQERMGTTLVLFLFVGSPDVGFSALSGFSGADDFAVIAHVGDSRVYRVRSGKIERLTEDHSIVATSRSPREWGTAPRKRKFVTRALGTRPSVTPDVRILEDLEAGDVFLLCSDGLSDAVREHEMATIVEKAGKDRAVALRSLVHLANKRGGRDNITVVLAELLGDEAADPKGSTEELALPLPDAPPGKRSSGRRARSSRRGVGPATPP